MNFFKSVFSDDPDPSSSGSPRGEDAKEDAGEGEVADRDAPPDSLTDGGGGGMAGAWSFGGLIKTFATKSESVIQTYRRDLEEFGTGLKKETAAIREAASRAVKDLPVSLEVGASVAQDSLESMGQAIDDLGGSVWRGTAEIISQGKEVLLSVDDDVATTDQYSVDASLYNQGGSSKRYNRFEVQVLAIQSDPSTFSEEPEELEDFQSWKSEFQVADKEKDIESICTDNGALESILEKLVPQVVDYETFWSRYFYKVHKLKQVEDARANIVKRVISGEEDEDLSWEVDDDEEEEDRKEQEQEINATDSKKEIDESSEPVAVEKPIVKAQVENAEEKPLEKAQVEVDSVVEVIQPAVAEQKVESDGKADPAELNGDGLETKLDDKMFPEGKAEPGESSKDSDFSVVSSQPSMQEEDDLGWDEIEDIGDHDEKKVNVSSGSSNKVDLHKSLSAADEDEDLSWDIEDDEPVKP